MLFWGADLLFGTGGGAEHIVTEPRPGREVTMEYAIHILHSISQKSLNMHKLLESVQLVSEGLVGDI